MSAGSVGLVIGQLHRGGAEKQLVQLAVELKKRDWDVFVYCLSQIVAPHDTTLRQAGIPLRTFGGRGKQLVSRVRGLRRATLEDGVDVVHSFLVGPTVLTAMALGWRRSDPAVVGSNRSQNEARSFWRRSLEGWALRSADHVTVNYEAGLAFTQDFYGVPRSRLTVIHNGVEDLSSGLPSRADARAALDLPVDLPLIAGVFRLSREKNLDLFCTTVERALAEVGRGICVIAGDGPLRAALAQRVAASPCRNAFRLLGAYDNVPTLLAAADIFLLTSRFEGLPNGVMEAMAAGVPVVATAVGGLPDLVEDGDSGFLRPPDASSLSDCCVELLRNADAHCRVGENAQARMRSAFSIEAMADRHRALYRDLARRRGR